MPNRLLILLLLFSASSKRFSACNDESSRDRLRRCAGVEDEEDDAPPPPIGRDLESSTLSVDALATLLPLFSFFLLERKDELPDFVFSVNSASCTRCASSRGSASSSALADAEPSNCGIGTIGSPLASLNAANASASFAAISLLIA